MDTKLTRFANGLMEAVWLAAIIITPVFFNIYTSRIFEPDKIALLRSLALLGAAAWIIKSVGQGQVDWGRIRAATWRERLRSLLKVPLVLPALGLAAAYLVSTLLSVTPRFSLLGSYQRLQGTYTMFSYLALFALIAVNLRRKAQIRRLVTTVILASLPVALYGILQRYEIDPIPWGGDTTRRVAANLGNAIFVAAYLIMAVPLTLGRIVESFSDILDENQHDLAPHIVRGTVYVFVGAIQLIAIYFSLSRGPILGLLAGTFFMFLLLSLYWGKRWLTLGTIGVAAALGIFLAVFAIPGGPLDGLRSNENIGRIGNVFQTESGTGRVRVLIWRGAAKLVSFHEPLTYPDGRVDPWNALRPFVGYGPESMHVAYNRFYPYELASIESRNASPDRSHNETWDALVITGLFGLAAEQALFIAVFFFGLKWLGMLNSARQRNLFLGLILGGGLASSIAFAALIDVGYLGVGLPFGMLLGLLAYLTMTSVFSQYARPESAGERRRALVLMMFLAAVITHYVEVHFGIAIAATRAYFWIYSAVLLSAGFWMTIDGSYGQKARATLLAGLSGEWLDTAPRPDLEQNANSKRRRAAAPVDMRSAYAWTIGSISGLLLSVMTFNYLTNSNRFTAITDVIRQSLTILPGEVETPSYGILALFLTAWLAFTVLAAAEWVRNHPGEWRPVLQTTGLVSLGIWLLYMLIHAIRLISVVQASSVTDLDTSNLDVVLRQAGALEGLVSQFYFAAFLLVVLLGYRLMRASEPQTRPGPTEGINIAIATAVILVALAGSWRLNLRVIHADVDFKIADPYSRWNNPEGWQIAIALYQRANAFAPTEDYYYLFLGKGYLELAQLLDADNPLAVQELLFQAEADLMRAQEINPLNTDHTANLARLYRFWADLGTQQGDPQSLLLRASDYYARAVELSPNNAVIWNEWALLYLQSLNNPTRGLELLMHSLEVDPLFNGTYGILGDYYGSLARAESSPDAVAEKVDQAVAYYRQAIEVSRFDNNKYLYSAAMGGLYELTGDYPAAISAYMETLSYADENQVYRVEDTIAKIFARAEDYESALEYAELALAHAPEEQKATQQQLIDYITGLATGP